MGKRYLQKSDGSLVDYKSEFDFDLKLTLETLGDYAHWDGYITPDGYFLPTKPSHTDYWNGSYFCHRDYADDYIYCVLGNEDIDKTIRESERKVQEKYKSEMYYLNGIQDYVIEYLGWVSIGHSNLTKKVYSNVPHRDYFGHQVTEIQKKIALEIYKANDYAMDDYFLTFDEISPIETE